MRTANCSNCSTTLLLVAGVLCLAGCKDDPATNPGQSLPGVDETGGAGRCEGTFRAVNEEFCAGDAVVPDCGQVDAAQTPIDICGVPIKAPPTDSETSSVVEITRSANVEEYSGSGPPELSCFEPEDYPDPPDPDSSEEVTVDGIAKIFANGCESDEVTIEIYTVKRTGGSDDGELDELVGSAVVTASDCTIDGVSEEVEEGCEDVRWECRYSYPGVPTETELVFRTSGDAWGTLYDYGVFIRNSDVAAGIWEHDVRALAADDYTVIPQTAMGSPMTPGKGAMAGEIHDCGDVRLGNAVADVDAPKFLTTYFTNDEDKPMPDQSARASSTLSLYAALNVTSGPVAVAAAGVQDGALVAVGFFRGRVHADSVTSFTFRGLKPFQVPASP